MSLLVAEVAAHGGGSAVPVVAQVGAGLLLVADAALCTYFETAATATKAPRKVANWLINIFPSVLTEKECEIESCPVPPVTLAGLVDVVEEGICSVSQAREVLEVLWNAPEQTAAAAAASLGYKKADSGALEALVDKVIAENPDKVALVKGGNMKLINALTGQVMKNSNPKPNPKLVTEILMAKLGL
jgi:aspartyl-tRNA(Asn)/glutamyl-tRNA(Gln) amidotransferase subunit B